MKGATATVHGAVSLVNAIATGYGATLGTSLVTTARVTAVPGKGISINTRSQSSRLLNMTICNVVPKDELRRHRISVYVTSQVPTGCGLKSSSSVSTAVAMACSRVFNPDMSEKDMLAAGVDASIRSGVSVTGAYDDVCGCYYGGFNVTHNSRSSLVEHRRAPPGLASVIFVPEHRRRRSIRNLRKMARVLNMAWKAAREGRHWEAMTMNGLAVSPVLGPDPYLLNSLLEAGALGASLSGNGPAVAAVVRAGGERDIEKVFKPLEGRTITTTINNSKAFSDGL
ncbi:MAG: shikimate kinase [Nitrosopumilaceae archaeon]|nr:shikimate kinase [Nitrosopumilaceae archaeon]